jgi:hypothetical protein
MKIENRPDNVIDKNAIVGTLVVSLILVIFTANTYPRFAESCFYIVLGCIFYPFIEYFILRHIK